VFSIQANHTRNPRSGKHHIIRAPQRIAYCLTNGNRQDVQKTIVASLRGYSRLVSHAQGDVDEPSGLLEAQTSLREILLRSGASSAVELYVAKHDKEVAKRGVGAWDQVSDVGDLMKSFDMLFKFTQDDE